MGLHFGMDVQSYMVEDDTVVPTTAEE